MTKGESKSAGGQYRKYSKELKEEVCQLAESGTLTYKELGAKFEIHPTLISKWLAARRSDGSEAFRGRGIRTELEAELSRLKKENNDLKLEREILKKAAAYFAKHQA
jgi:transposase